MQSKQRESLVIIGSGPAGYTAAIYAARANLKPLLVEGFFSGPAGGQLMTTTEVENFPGFPQGVMGPDLVQRCRDQAVRFGTRLISDDVQKVDLSRHPYQIGGRDLKVAADSIIIATGASANRLDIPGTADNELWQKGVTACAVCDGAMPLFRNRPLFVIGGGDSAVEEAMFLTKYGSRVYIVHRRGELRASKIMQERALRHPKIEILWNSVVVAVLGDKSVQKVRLRNLQTNVEEEREAGGVFFAIGHTPNTAFLGGQLELHPNGYIKVEPGSCRTSCDLVFAAGDVQDYEYRQAITAAGSGCMASMEAERALSARGLI